MTTHTGDDHDRGRGFTITYSAREILDRLDRIEARLDRLTGIGAVVTVLAGAALGGIVSHFLG